MFVFLGEIPSPRAYPSNNINSRSFDFLVAICLYLRFVLTFFFLFLFFFVLLFSRFYRRVYGFLACSCCACRTQYDCMACPCPLSLLYYTAVVYLLYSNLVTLYVSRMKNRHGHWVFWMSTRSKNGLMATTHAALRILL